MLQIFKLTRDWHKANSFGSAIKRLSPKLSVTILSQNESTNKSFGRNVNLLKLMSKDVRFAFNSLTSAGMVLKFLRERFKTVLM